MTLIQVATTSTLSRRCINVMCPLGRGLDKFCRFKTHRILSEKGSTLKGNNLLHWGEGGEGGGRSNFFPFRERLLVAERQNNLDRVSSPHPPHNQISKYIASASPFTVRRQNASFCGVELGYTLL